MYHNEPDILPMIDNRRRLPITAKSRSRTVDEDSGSGGGEKVQRIVYIAALEVLVTCERERGASVWETGGRMRLLAHLPHGRDAINSSRLQGTSLRAPSLCRAAASASSPSLLDVCATVLDSVHLPATAAERHDGGHAGPPDAAQQAQGVQLHGVDPREQALGTAQDGSGRLQDGRIVTTGMDRHLCVWADRPPHGLCNTLLAPCAQLCLVWHAAHAALLSGGTDGMVRVWDARRPGISPNDDSVSSGSGHAAGAWVHRLIILGRLGTVLSAGDDCAIVECAPAAATTFLAMGAVCTTHGCRLCCIRSQVGPAAAARRAHT